MPPSFQVLEQRLRGRSKDTEEQMQRRLETARAEASSYADYDYVVVNDELEPTVVRLQEIIAAERSRDAPHEAGRRGHPHRRSRERGH